MKKRSLWLVCAVAISLVILFSGLAVAAAPDSRGPSVIATPRYEKITLVHYAKGGIPGRPVKPPEDEEPDKDLETYALLGVKWDMSKFSTGIPYVIDLDGAPDNAEDEIIAAYEAWDDATSVELFNDSPTVNNSAEPSTDVPDFVNTVSWRRVVPPKAIAVTFIWSNTVTNEIVDCDVILNTKHDWGIGVANAFDVRNIMTHEVGHVVGLADLYDDIYSELTMYGYGAEGETKKSSLENGDMFGCQSLYGL
jgi:hypothetical protein